MGDLIWKSGNLESVDFASLLTLFQYEMSSTVDLTAFPIVRLDQISGLNDSLLEKAIKGVEEILIDSPNPKMASYLHKQLENMRKESLQRKAESRIQDLLSGAKSLLDNDYSQFDAPHYSTVSSQPNPVLSTAISPKSSVLSASTSLSKPANIPNVTSYN
ncbi:hypothetical protein EON65_46345, partial [archaeon]